MRVLEVLEQRFNIIADGYIRSPSGIFAYKFWQRYLEVFDSVNLVARVLEDASNESCSRDLLTPGPMAGGFPFHASLILSVRSSTS